MCVGGGWGVWPWSGLWSVQLFVPRTHQHLQHSCRVFGGISSSSSSLFLKRLICGGRPAWRQQADAISTTYMAITPTKTPRAAGTYCTLLCVYCPFHFFFFISFSPPLTRLAVLSSAMATQEMNVDKENPDGRKMEEEEEGWTCTEGQGKI